MKPYSILIIEDNYIVAQRLAEQVSQAHHTPLICTDPTTITPAMLHSVDLALVDIVLHGEHAGIAVAHTLHKARKPVIFVTAYSDENLIHQALSVHPAGILVKPVDSRQLRVTMMRAMYVPELIDTMADSEEGLTVADIQTRLQPLNPSQAVWLSVRLGDNRQVPGYVRQVDVIKEDDSDFPRGTVVFRG